MTQPKPRPFRLLRLGDTFRLLGQEDTFVKINLSYVFTNSRDSRGKSWSIPPHAPVIRIHNHEPA